jgi:hypothetical protein
MASNMLMLIPLPKLTWSRLVEAMKSYDVPALTIVTVFDCFE